MAARQVSLPNLLLREVSELQVADGLDGRGIDSMGAMLKDKMQQERIGSLNADRQHRCNWHAEAPQMS